MRTFICAPQVKKVRVWKPLRVIDGIQVCTGEESQDVCTLAQELGMCIEYLLTSGRMQISTGTEGTDN